MPSPLSLGRITRFLAMLPLILGLAACRVEIGKDPSPTPAPSPTPTPTPTPAPTTLSATGLTPAPVALETEASPATRVAAASAEYFEAAAAAAADAASAVRRALSRAVEVPAESEAQLRAARESLGAAADAYRKAEASVFVVDPDSAEELRAQPDPLRAGAPDGRDDTLAELSASLDEMDRLLARPLDRESVSHFLAEADGVETKAGQLETGLRAMADAWKDGDRENFRQLFFLPSSEGAVARVFQGLLAVTGDILPGMVSDATDGAPAEIGPRLLAVKDLYLGDFYDTEPDGPSLHLLVQNVSPVQAALTRASLARAVALAGVLEISPANEALRRELASTLREATRQLTFAAQTLGIVIVEE